MYGGSSPIGAPPAPAHPSPGLDIGNVLRDSWSLFSKDLGPLIVAGLIPTVAMIVISIVGFFVFWVPAAATSGNEHVAGVAFVVGLLIWLAAIVLAAVLTIPFYMAILRMVSRRVREGRRAEMADVKGCFDRAGSLIWATLVLGFLIGLGFVFFIVPGVYMAVIWAYALPLIIDRRLSLGEAMGESKRMVTESGFWPTLGIGLVVLLIGGAVSGATGNIGQIFTVPWQFAALMAMYFTASGEGRLLPSGYPGMPSSAYQGGAGMATTQQPWQGAPMGPAWRPGPAGPPPWQPPPPPQQAEPPVTPGWGDPPLPPQPPEPPAPPGAPPV